MPQTLAAPSHLGRLRDRQRVETRERLFQAGLAEIRREGFAAAQVDRIVAAVGVSRGAFYFHFPTKADLLLEWQHRREADIVSRLGRGGGEPRTLRGALLEVVAFLADLVASSDGRLVLDTLAIHVREGSDPESYLLLGEIGRRLASASSRGELRDDVDVRQVTILFLSNVFGFLVARATSPPPHPEPDLLVDVFLSGVTARRRKATDDRRPDRVTRPTRTDRRKTRRER